MQEQQSSHWSITGTAVMIKLTCPPVTAVNQLNSSYIIDILIITFPTAHLCKIYLTLILSIQRWVQFSECMVKIVVLNAGINSTGDHNYPSVILGLPATSASKIDLLYLPIFWANTHMFSTFIQADLIYLHRALEKENKEILLKLHHQGYALTFLALWKFSMSMAE